MDESETEYETSCSIGWKGGSGGILAGFLAALCCAVPPLLGVLGLSTLAGVLGSMPFTYHLALQWLALGLILFTWVWFGWKWFRMNRDDRRSPWTILTGLILIVASLYVAKTWYAHMFLMG